MKTHFALLSCLLAAGSLPAQEVPDAPRGGRIEWRRDLDAALREAAASHRPLMLYFTHDL